MKLIKRNSYVFGVCDALSDKDLNGLIGLFEAPPSHSKGVLGGRGSIGKMILKNDLPVILKYYKRGGFVRHFVKEVYLKTGKTRGEQEFEMLNKARSLGISAPKPVAWAYKGRLFYRGWIVMEEIENSLSLVDYCMAGRNDFDEILRKVIKEIKLLISNKVLHVDLHPGNILISNGNVTIIDFDKAVITGMGNSDLIAFYIQRWERAAKKHRLPGTLATLLNENIKNNAIVRNR